MTTLTLKNIPDDDHKQDLKSILEIAKIIRQRTTKKAYLKQRELQKMIRNGNLL